MEGSFTSPTVLVSSKSSPKETSMSLWISGGGGSFTGVPGTMLSNVLALTSTSLLATPACLPTSPDLQAELGAGAPTAATGLPAATDPAGIDAELADGAGADAAATGRDPPGPVDG